MGKLVQGKDFEMMRNGFALCAVLALSAMGLFAGCGGETSAPSTEQKPADKTAAIRTIPAAPAESEASPAVDLNSELGPEASPEDVCRRFLQCLQVGERTAAEKLLTQRALTTTKRADLNLESPGGPKASFSVRAPRYSTNKRELATVDCVVSEELHGQKMESTISWLLRSEPAGWRICGMILDMEAGESLDFLSFENVADVERIKSSVSADATGEETAVAENNEGATIRK
jgi:hypothetical protein